MKPVFAIIVARATIRFKKEKPVFNQLRTDWKGTTGPVCYVSMMARYGYFEGFDDPEDYMFTGGSGWERQEVETRYREMLLFPPVSDADYAPMDEYLPFIETFLNEQGFGYLLEDPE